MSCEIEKEWVTSSGLTARACMVNESHRCGYVLIPDGHLFHGKEYNHHLDKSFWNKMKDEQFKGSPIDMVLAAYDNDKIGPRISYAINVHGGVTFSGQMSGHEGWWFGFDCMHLDDRSLKYDGLGGVFRSLEFVIDECELMAAQIQQLGQV
jgi:hypothetical protein